MSVVLSLLGIVWIILAFADVSILSWLSRGEQLIVGVLFLLDGDVLTRQPRAQR